MSIFDTIKSAMTPSPKSPAAGPNDGMPTPATATTTVPPTEAATDFSKMWTAPAAATPDIKAPIFSHDAEQFNAAVSKFDFTQSPGFETKAQAALSGDMNAFREILNQVAQSAFAQSTQVSSSLSEQAAFHLADRLNAQAPTQYTNQKSTEILEAKLAGLTTNPAFAPTIDMVKRQILQSDPTASAEMVAARTMEYLKNLSGSIVDTLNPGSRPGTPGQNPAGLQTMPVQLSYSDIFRTNAPTQRM